MFVNPGVMVNGAYYRDVLLLQQLLPAIRQVSDEFFIFQQDSAPARARETINLFERENSSFISTDFWSPNSPDLNQVVYKVWGIMQQRVYQTKMQDVDSVMIDCWTGMQQSVINNAAD